MSVGLACRKLGYCPNSGIVVGIPMAAWYAKKGKTGK